MQPRCSPLFVSLNPSALAKIADVSEGRSLAYGTELAARCSLVGGGDDTPSAPEPSEFSDPPDQSDVSDQSDLTTPVHALHALSAFAARGYRVAYAKKISLITDFSVILHIAISI